METKEKVKVYGAIVSLIGALGLHMYGKAKQGKYVEEISPLCAQVLKESDRDESFCRDICNNMKIQTSQPTVQLSPGDYRTRNVVLKISGGSWSDNYRFPESKLKGLVRRPQHR